MKKYLAGFVAGVIVSVSTVGVYATAQSYTLNKFETPIYINSVKYPTDALPVLSLNINGGENTYVPLRNFSEMMGADVSYNQAEGRIDIKGSTSTSSNVATGSTDATTNATVDTTENNGSNNNRGENNGNNNNKYKDKDKNKVSDDSVDLDDVTSVYNSTYKLNVYTIDGVEYVEIDDIEDVYFDDDYKEDNDDYDFEDKDNTKDVVYLEYNDRVVLDNITVISVDDEELVTFEFFINQIYPIIK